MQLTFKCYEILGAAIVGIYGYNYIAKKPHTNNNDDDDSKGRERSLSFNSEVMMKSFPSTANVPQPIINILNLFHELPSVNDMIEEVSTATTSATTSASATTTASATDMHLQPKTRQNGPRSIQFNSIQFKSIQFNSIQINSNQPKDFPPY